MSSEPQDININIDIKVRFEQPLVVYLKPPPGPATHQSVTLGGTVAGHTIDVDTVNETVTVGYFDDHNDATSQPAGSSIVFASTDDNVATVAPDATDPKIGRITPVSAGTVTFTVSTRGADGNPVFPDQSSDQLTINPGAAAGQRITVGPA